MCDIDEREVDLKNIGILQSNQCLDHHGSLLAPKVKQMFHFFLLLFSILYALVVVVIFDM